MKKKKCKNVQKLFIAVFLVRFTFYGYTAFSLRNTAKKIDYTGGYTEKQINSAMNTVARHFTLNYGGCELVKLYTGEKSFSNAETVVIYGDFITGKNVNAAFQPESEYKHWRFEMKYLCGVWIITNNGYG